MDLLGAGRYVAIVVSESTNCVIDLSASALTFLFFLFFPVQQTQLAKAVAGEANAVFLSIGPR